MSGNAHDDADPDLTAGVPISSIGDAGLFAGHVGDDAVMIARVGDSFLAVDAACTHYHAPLTEGLIVGDTVRCPWHHACFNLRTGEAERAPAFSPLACWSTSVQGDKVYVLKRMSPPASPVSLPNPAVPQRIVIVGAGAAGFAAVERLRRIGYAGSLTLLSDDAAPPVDRPNLSKDYLAGTAPAEWLPLRDDAFYTQQRIDLRLNANVARIHIVSKEVELGDGGKIPFDRLLLCTGAEASRLSGPGLDLPHVHTLRSLEDSRAISARAANARRAVVVGASFIGLEAAAALRTRGLEVHVVARDRCPMERVLGAEMGAFIQRLHEDHGVIFHLENTVLAIDEKQVSLKMGGSIDADLVVIGVGVRPNLTLAEQAGLTIDRGVKVDAYLQTSVPGIFAAGDIARWPDPHSGADIRVEHWVVAQRQGQTGALNMLGGRERFDAVPFFWSQHYDVPINYVGHAESWDAIAVDGNIAARDCALRYMRSGRVIAVATINRDIECLRAEVGMERERV
ncbi:FAD-dependent oxidoreductase [Paraburkholderia sp. DHOC27]|uniref:FAD-dependent oxidoreductase n=1 Tax=Paraburkholderia sp. DHOC27 TaxID=2303330 RepID=UPI000E3D7066|nr:FAD-dependent oxidoreductase [Paraburkholderia sp. DHOC27]RFU48875.1 pyridine nucleotide-disulfide oxidoreductase [Paraburkholderia sp. DHOC27]